MSGYYPNHIPYFYTPVYYQSAQAQRSAQAWQQVEQAQQAGQQQQTGQVQQTQPGMQFQGQQAGQAQQAGQQQQAGQAQPTQLGMQFQGQMAGQVQQTQPGMQFQAQYPDHSQAQPTQPGVQYQGQQQAYSQTQPQVTYPTGANTAYAMLIAGPDYPTIAGLVTFADIPGGVMVCADVQGLPSYKPASGEKSPVGPFGFHIHEKGMCEVGNPEKPFEGSGGHWNPTSQPHGNHAGDFPVLVAGNGGRAKMCFITDRFTVDEILGRSVMIHENPDDYRSQPAGNSGKRIACGSIKPWNSFQQL